MNSLTSSGSACEFPGAKGRTRDGSRPALLSAADSNDYVTLGTDDEDSDHATDEPVLMLGAAVPKTPRLNHLNLARPRGPARRPPKRSPAHTPPNPKVTPLGTAGGGGSSSNSVAPRQKAESLSGFAKFDGVRGSVSVGTSGSQSTTGISNNESRKESLSGFARVDGGDQKRTAEGASSQTSTNDGRTGQAQVQGEGSQAALESKARRLLKKKLGRAPTPSELANKVFFFEHISALHTGGMPSFEKNQLRVCVRSNDNGG